ncbi:ubiquinol-cytochrome c reductase iron-sulfur subunit [Acidobacteriota bacterium]
MKRRNFINFFLGGSLIGTVLSLLYPVIRYLIPSKQVEAVVNNVIAAKTGEIAPNTHKIFKFGTSPGILIKMANGELMAFNALCTHLTCTVIYESETETLLCPCHNGRFDLSGEVVSGPPPNSLEVFNVEISGEDIVVSKRG